jgi:hypothetical protein
MRKIPLVVISLVSYLSAGLYSAQLPDSWKPTPPLVTINEKGIPSDAIILFDGSNLDAWCSVKSPTQPASWKIIDNTLVVQPNSGDICTKLPHKDIQLHIEFCEPSVVLGSGQGRGNSGIKFMGMYELQVLDSYNNPTYVNGQAGAVYLEHAPLVNAAKKPGEWQVYEVVWIAPRFNSDGTLSKPARMTVFHNGVLVQHDFALLGPTGMKNPHYTAHPESLPLKLQDHHNPVAFRNIWLRDLEKTE